MSSRGKTCGSVVTSRDLVNALRAEAPPEYQQLITDLFERIMFYDLQVDAASARD